MQTAGRWGMLRKGITDPVFSLTTTVFIIPPPWYLVAKSNRQQNVLPRCRPTGLLPSINREEGLQVVAEGI
jgi:hypothetical protein